MEAEEVMGRKSYGINMLPAGTADEQRERGQLHTAYETETAFYSCIRAGDVQGVEKMMWECLKAGVFAFLSPEFCFFVLIFEENHVILCLRSNCIKCEIGIV